MLLVRQVRQVKRVLHVGAGVAAGQLPPCREPQIDALQSALRQHMAGASGRAVYVAGLPGTGTDLTCLLSLNPLTQQQQQQEQQQELPTSARPQSQLTVLYWCWRPAHTSNSQR